MTGSCQVWLTRAAALMRAAKTPDLYACAASINGASNLPVLIKWDRKFIGGKIWTQSIGDPGEDNEVLRQTSPYHQADQTKIPILLIHAKDDTRVPVARSRAKADRLKKRKKRSNSSKSKRVCMRWKMKRQELPP